MGRIMSRMNTIGIENNLDRARIRKLLATGLLGCVLTGVGDFLLGYATPVDVGGGAFDTMLSTAPNLSDGALFAGGLLGMFGLFIEGLSFFGVWRLMADAAPRLAHTYRSGIFFYLWLAPVGCHMNVGLLNYAYKQLWLVSPEAAHAAVTPMYCAFCVPLYVLLAAGWVPMLVAQWKAFAQGKTPYPTRAKWFTLATGAIPTLVVALLLGADTALGGGIGTMFLSVGNAVTFGGLLGTLPSEECFEEFRARLAARS